MKRLMGILLMLGFLFFSSLPKLTLAQNTSTYIYTDDDFYQEKTALLPQGSISIPTPQRQLSNYGSRPPNIVVILTDDQPPNTIGLAGNSFIKTPNIDSIGNRGVYFRNMYLPTGQCSPSRSSLWTGKMPHTHGVSTNGPALPADQLTLPQILKANGYYMGAVGKCDLGRDWKTDLGFDFYLSVGGVEWDWYNYTAYRNGVPEQHTEYITDFLTTEAISYLTQAVAAQQKNQKPFLLWFAPTAPHVPTTPPVGSNRYSLSDIPSPVSESDDLSTKPPQLSADVSTTQFSMHRQYLNLGAVGVKNRLKDAYEVISNIDNNVGKILTTLRNLGVLDDTIIIYLSDNGLFYGEHQLSQKGPSLYEEVIKTPFIISYPKMYQQGVKIDSLASSIDILPTLLDTLGITIPSDIQGKSFLPVLKGETSQYRSSVMMEYAKWGVGDFPMRGVVANGYKFIHYLTSTVNGVTYDGKDFELYNLGVDPFEMNNLMKRLGPGDHPLQRMLSDSTYGKIIRKLIREMAIWQTETADPVRKILTNLSVNSTSPTTIQVAWKTSEPLTSEVEYREANCPACSYQEIHDLNPATDHNLELTNLKSGTSYSVRIFSIGGNGNGGYIPTSVSTVGFAGDLNGDGKVDVLDLRRLLANFTNPSTSLGTSIFDYNILVWNFGK